MSPFKVHLISLKLSQLEEINGAVLFKQKKYTQLGFFPGMPQCVALKLLTRCTASYIAEEKHHRL